MCSALISDLIGPIVRAHLAGKRAEAVAGYARILPLINQENQQCGFRASKVALVAGSVIRSDFCRHPIPALHLDTKAELLALARPPDPLVLR